MLMKTEVKENWNKTSVRQVPSIFLDNIIPNKTILLLYCFQSVFFMKS